jgi:glycosyltransferase involved in cell wall biosynthesis
MTDMSLSIINADLVLPSTGLAPRFSIVIPVYNEENAIEETVRYFVESYSKEESFELIVINDGSTDKTGVILDSWLQMHPNSIRVINHKINQGYGAALKTGLRNARSDLIAITDADGSYPHDRILDMVETLITRNAAMVVGARTGEDVEYSKIRSIPKIFLKAYVSWVARSDVPDFNSGLRVFKRSVAEKFLNILPSGFSFTTTIYSGDDYQSLSSGLYTHKLPSTYRKIENSSYS